MYYLQKYIKCRQICFLKSASSLPQVTKSFTEAPTTSFSSNARAQFSAHTQRHGKRIHIRPETYQIKSMT